MSSNFLAAAGRPRRAAPWAYRALIHRVRRSISRMLARRIHRAAIEQLSAMSDRELKDIGITRGAIDRAVTIGHARPHSSAGSC